MKTLRVGVIGCGGIAQMMHIPYLNEYEQFEIMAISDLYAPVLNAVGDHYHIDPESRYIDWHDLLARQDLDAVGIFHSGSHHATVLAALEAGKHIFVEKPLAWNVREVQEIVSKTDATGLTVQVGYHKLYDPAFAYTRDQVQKMHDLGAARITVLHPDDSLGRSTHRVRRGNGEYLEGHVEPTAVERMLPRMRADASGGTLAPLVDEALGARKDNLMLRMAYGMMPDSLIHQVYTLFGFLGKPERVVQTDIWREGLSIHTQLAYPGDVHVSLDWHYLSHLKDYFEEYAFFGNYDRVYMRMPAPYFANFPTPVVIQGGDGELAWEKTVTVSHDEAFRRELLAFYDNVMNHTKPISSVEDALEHARLMQAIIEAAP